MDLFTTNAATSLSAQAAQRADREREYRRISHERAAETGTTARQAGRAAQSEVVGSRRRHRFPFVAMFRNRVRSAL